MRRSELKSIIREIIEEIDLEEVQISELTPRQRELKKGYKNKVTSQHNSLGMFPGDHGKDPLTYGKNIYRYRNDPKRTSASITTKASGGKRANKADTNKVKDSIKQSQGKGTNQFSPHFKKKKPNLPK